MGKIVLIHENYDPKFIEKNGIQYPILLDENNRPYAIMDGEKTILPVYYRSKEDLLSLHRQLDNIAS